MHAVMYAQTECAESTLCRAARPDGTSICPEMATNCVHATRDYDSAEMRTALCEEHTSQCRAEAKPGLLIRVHSI